VILQNVGNVPDLLMLCWKIYQEIRIYKHKLQCKPCN
jgi:hypothetical protein